MSSGGRARLEVLGERLMFLECVGGVGSLRGCSCGVELHTVWRTSCDETSFLVRDIRELLGSSRAAT